jgi:hypothetical protein
LSGAGLVVTVVTAGTCGGVINTRYLRARLTVAGAGKAFFLVFLKDIEDATSQ